MSVRLPDSKIYPRIVAIVSIIIIIEFIFSMAMDLTRDRYEDPIKAKLYGKHHINKFLKPYVLDEIYIDNVRFKIIALGYYNPTVRVMYIDRYNKNAYDKLSPFDLVFIWGDLAKPYYKNRIKASHTYRAGGVSYQTSNFLENIILDGQSSNNHIIPANDEVKRKIENLSVGEIVTFEGYVVKVEAHYPNSPPIYWGDDSVSLMDKHNFPKGRWISEGVYILSPLYFGVGKCDIYYVTNLQKHEGYGE